MATVYIALGSNIGDREVNLNLAIEKFGDQAQVIKRSSIYQTEPWGFHDQAPFLNMVIQVQTNLTPRSLLTFLKNLEVEIGRTLTFRNGPRVIDLDILFYDDLVLAEEGLEIPHPRLKDRVFVLVPLCEIAPDLIHPVTKTPLDKYLAKLEIVGILMYKKRRE